MQEGTYSRQRHQPRRNYGPQVDPYGNVVYYDQPPQYYQSGNQLPPIPADEVVQIAPGDAWLEQLDESLRLAVLALKADLYLKAEKPDDAMACLEVLAPHQPREAADLANEFLRAWGRLRNPVQSGSSPRYVMSGGQIIYTSSSMNRSPAISLTRAMQARNIRELSGLLRRLDALKLPLLDNDAVVGAFTASHSPAEVFRTEDIEAVFGPSKEIKLETLAGLSQTMRERLASQWRQSRVQQQVKTQRTDKQVEAEVLRGYEVVMKLIEDGLQREPQHWQLTLARAAAFFDLAEFQYGKKVDLAVYVEKRDEAFNGFERAAELYAAALPHFKEREETPLVFQQWFNANLGASDLSYVTRQQEPETNQLARIREAILSLPGGAAERHLSAFAKSLGQSANTLRPELKPRYLRAGLLVAGDHFEAEDARKLVTYYDDLLRELEFVVSVDGDATVGHDRPFGVFVSLRHTADIEREAGGFGRYLRNQKSSPYYSSPYGQPVRNFIEEFDQQAREKLIDHFDIKTVTFLDEKVESRGYGRPGWRETPLAFLLLKAKDGAVDRLPALRMDLDFMDARGQVVLPVESQITLIDARPERIEPRPVADLEITQILDDREASAGLLTLEIKATGKGLVPALPELLRTNSAGMQVEEFTDHGLAIAKIDTEGDHISPVSEQNWLMKLRVRDTADSLMFKFPESLRSDAKVVYNRYADADLVEVEPSIALAGLNLRPRPVWHWFVWGGIALALAGGAVWWLRRHQPVMTSEVSAYRVPETVTPFNLIGLLRRMHADESLRWSATHKTELTQTIQELEQRFFDRRHNGDPDPDLADIGHRWVRLTSNGK
jgi:tetratricopeptide (TPR) repeat protein